MPSSLLSERTVKRWVAAGGTPAHYEDLFAREQAFSHRVRDTWGPDAAEELDDIIGQQICAEQARVLTYVGTVLTQHGLEDLWQQIYAVCAISGITPTSADEHQRFLADQMAAVHGETLR